MEDQRQPATGRANTPPVDITYPALRPVRPAMTVQDVLRSDEIAPPETLLQSSGYDLGIEPVDTERYFSDEFHRRELERLWPKVWQYACQAYDLPNAGDIYVYRIVDRSAIIVRQGDGSLKAFVNSCLHRGRELCEVDSHQQQLRCPYHAFTWSLSGELKWVPAKWDFPQVDQNKFSLPEVKVDIWNEFVFVNFDENAAPLSDYLGKLPEQWKDWDYSQRYKAVHVEKLINCNWKVCQEAFVETLHVYASHPQAAALTPDTLTQYDIYPDEPHFSRFHSVTGWSSEHLVQEPEQQEVLDSFTVAYLPEVFDTEAGYLREGENARQAIARLSRDVYQERLGIDASRLPESELVDGTEYWIFPNFVPWPSLANPIVYRFRPTHSPDQSIWETMLFLPFEGERPSGPQIIKLGPDDRMADVPELGYLSDILQQDADQLPAIQRGLKTSRTRKVNLARYQEARIRHFHQTLDQYLARDPSGHER